MTITLQWTDILIRLGLATVACVLVGFDRGEHGEPAGVRTTLLVGLAATVAMLAANLLLATAGKHSDSFVTLDMMRLPLGILTGMGFIGAGTILKRGETVQGLTTAATLWFVTVAGICVGAGLIGLGVTASIIGIAVLSGLRWLERHLPKFRRATLTVVVGTKGPDVYAKGESISEGKVALRSFTRSTETDRRTFVLRVLWRDRGTGAHVPPSLAALARQPGIVELKWEG
jgi:putative Mg2+ transporter-C (MgtC) family protein